MVKVIWCAPTKAWPIYRYYDYHNRRLYLVLYHYNLKCHQCSFPSFEGCITLKWCHFLNLPDISTCTCTCLYPLVILWFTIHCKHIKLLYYAHIIQPSNIHLILITSPSLSPRFPLQMRQCLQSLPQTPRLLHLLLLTAPPLALIKQPLPLSPPGRVALLAAVPPVMTAAAAAACPLLPQTALPVQQPLTSQQPQKPTPVQLILMWLQHLCLPLPQKILPLLHHHYYPLARAVNSMICNSQIYSGRLYSPPCSAALLSWE